MFTQLLIGLIRMMQLPSYPIYKNALIWRCEMNKKWSRRWTDEDEDFFDRLDLIAGIVILLFVVILFSLIFKKPDYETYAPRDISNYAISPEMVKFMHNEGHAEVFSEYDID